MDPSSVWVAVTGDLRQAPEGRGGHGLAQGDSVAKAFGRCWVAVALVMLPSRVLVTSTTPPATQASRVAHRVLEQPIKKEMG
jgi:hypothetical protein